MKPFKGNNFISLSAQTDLDMVYFFTVWKNVVL